MRKSKYTEQIVNVLREVEAVGKVQDVVRRLGITETNFYPRAGPHSRTALLARE